MLGRLPGLDLLVLEPEGDLLLGAVDAVAAVADVAADVLVREEKLVELFPLARGFVASDGNL